LLLGADAAALAAQQRLEDTARLRLVLRHGLPAGSLERLLAALGPGPLGPGPVGPGPLAPSAR
jgi:8-amino-7-oxononanoate synthase